MKKNKISKIKYRRTAVGHENGGDKIQGLLFLSPNKKRYMDTHMIINQIKKSYLNVYSPFYSGKIMKIETNDERLENLNEMVKKVAGSFCVCLRNDVFTKYDENKGKMILQINNNFDKSKKTYIDRISKEDKEKIADYLANVALKNELKKEIKYVDKKSNKEINYRSQDIIKELILATSFRYNYRKIREIDHNKLFYICKMIYEDKNQDVKKYKLDMDEKSIIMQKTKTHISEKENGIKRIELSCFDYDEKNDYKFNNNIVCSNGDRIYQDKLRKKYRTLRNFIVEYANGNKQERNNMIIGIRKLIILYIYGNNAYELNKERTDLYITKFDNYIEEARKKEYFVSEEETDIKKIRLLLKEKIKNNYREAESTLGADSDDMYWIEHFERATENYFKIQRRINKANLESFKICKYLWKEWISFMCSKYIDLGKGVYNFAIPNIDEINGMHELEFGNVQDSQFDGGITSFDYERIKLKESIERRLLTYVTFSSNILGRAVLNNSCRENKHREDILLYNVKDFYKENTLRKDAFKNVYKYFGGLSKWGNNVSKDDEIEIIFSIKESIYNIRNSIYHPTAKLDYKKSIKNIKLDYIIEAEYTRVKEVYTREWWRGKAPRFYKNDDLYKLMNSIYRKENRNRKSILSAKKILDKESKNNLIINCIDQNYLDKLKENPKEYVKFQKAMNFILAEIYNNVFSNLDDLKERFLNKIDYWLNSPYKRYGVDKKDLKELKEYIDINCTDLDFEETYQNIYKMHSAFMRKNNINKDEKDKKKNIETESVNNFLGLITKLLRNIFTEYIKNDANELLAFIRKPEIQEWVTDDTKQNDFDDDENELDKIKAIREVFINEAPDFDLYNDTKTKILSNQTLYDWYIMVKFLSASQLNELINNIKNYFVYRDDIEQRAIDSKNNKDSNIDGISEYYKNVLDVLQYAQLFSGNISYNVNDYFEEVELKNGTILSVNDQFAKYLSRYVDFGGNDFMKLLQFDTFNKYCNENREPIISKNLGYANLFGELDVLNKCIEKRVTSDDILKYKKIKSQIDTGLVFSIHEKDRNEEQNNQYQDFMKLKRQIELVDLVDLTNIINKMISKLVSWTYIRERDLMYFQLGVNYLRLFYNNGKNKLDERFHTIKNKNETFIKDGALLYQIIAMYTYDLNVFTIDENGEAHLDSKQQATGNSIKKFVEYCNEDLKDCPTYNWCLELFENLHQHEQLVKLRDRINHMHYLSVQDESLMDLFNNIYDGFFSYDIKLNNSVPKSIIDILRKYGVEATLDIRKEAKIKGHVNIYISDDDDENSQGLKPIFNERIKSYTHDELFVKQLKNVLTYKQKEKTR